MQLGCRKLTPSMKNDKQPSSRGIQVALLPKYGIVRFATVPRGKRRRSKYMVELPRGAYGLSCDELLAVLATPAAQTVIQKWRLSLLASPVHEEIDVLLRTAADNLPAAIAARHARLVAWESQRDLVQRCAGAMVEQMDRRAMRGMASKLLHATPSGMPPAVQIFKWGYELAVKACEQRAHGFNPGWDFEMAAMAFGDELEFELRYIDPGVGTLLDSGRAADLDADEQEARDPDMAEAA